MRAEIFIYETGGRSGWERAVRRILAGHSMDVGAPGGDTRSLRGSAGDEGRGLDPACPVPRPATASAGSGRRTSSLVRPLPRDRPNAQLPPGSGTFVRV